ncbi:hypothetical protein Dda_7000 [Drechslerella dactyloides]|uniref:Uncharacterized protein n=1 Tax=Drechslerella dactyloides TaxID=74499 RepID=A0AAD6NH26_DREDA|nr:hypothetical protein Dda_7000 [Drechslerella dactyloides]
MSFSSRKVSKSRLMESTSPKTTGAKVLAELAEAVADFAISSILNQIFSISLSLTDSALSAIRDQSMFQQHETAYQQDDKPSGITEQ